MFQDDAEFHRHRRSRAFAIKALAVCCVLVASGPALLRAQTVSPVQQAEALIQRGQTAAAVEILRSESTSHPSASVSYLLGFALLQQFEFSEAETWLRDAVIRAPGLPAYRHALAKSLLEQGKNLAAIDELSRAIAMDPRPDYYFARAMCALNVADFDRAAADLEATVARAESDSQAWYELGKLRVNEGDYAAASAALERALVLEPRHSEARYFLGLSQRRLGDHRAAMASFEQVLETIPGHVGALMHLGQLQMRAGEKEQGRATLERFSNMSRLRDEIEFHLHAVAKNPTNINGRLALARMQLEIGDTSEALEQLMAARRLEPARAGIYRSMAEAFRRQGRLEQAQRAEAYAAQLEARQNGGGGGP